QRAVLECAARGRPPASPAGRGDGGQASRGTWHLDGLFRSLALPGTQEDGREADDLRDRYEPSGHGTEEFRTGGRSGPGNDCHWRCARGGNEAGGRGGYGL